MSLTGGFRPLRLNLRAAENELNLKMQPVTHVNNLRFLFVVSYSHIADFRDCFTSLGLSSTNKTSFKLR